MLFVALFIWFLYLAIRLVFSYYVLLYSEEVGKAKMYIDESFRLTKKKVWKIISLILPFLVVLGVSIGLVQMGEEIFSEKYTPLFVLLSFLLFEGLASMIYLSTYKIIVKTDKEDENIES